MRDAAVQSLAVGFFDGVHLGHQSILANANLALTFTNHPLSVLAPARAPRLIMSLEDRIAAIRSCGVGEVVALDFTFGLSELAPTDFASRYLRLPSGEFPTIRCGANWRFGKGGAGDANWLRANGYVVETVEYASFGGNPISSSRIRVALASGKIEDAAAMLGRRYFVRGEVVGGKGIGRQLGFPTINLQLVSPDVGLPHGVYVVEAADACAVANYGLAPTMKERAWPTPVLEIHFLSTPSVRIMNGESLQVSFRRFLRSERCFDSQEALSRQIASDIREAKMAIGNHVVAKREGDVSHAGG